MGKKVKTVKVSTKGWLTRSFLDPGVEGAIKKWTKKGYTLVSQVPLNSRGGKTTHILLTFEKDG